MEVRVSRTSIETGPPARCRPVNGECAAPRRRTLALAVAASLAGGAAVEVQAQAFPPVIPLSTLDGTNGFKIDGEATFNYSGSSVAAAGDINGDGMDDLIIGAFFASFSSGYSGRSYVVFGRSSFSPTLPLATLDGSNGFKIDGEAAFDGSGISVAAAGDINGDGLDDLIIGAFGSDPNGESSGRSYVVFGRSNFPPVLPLATLDGSNGFKIDGEAAGDQSGGSVAAAGDVNGDGLDDLIIGASVSGANGGASGRSYVVFGRSSFPSVLPLAALNGSNGFKIDGEAAGDRSGFSVSSAGDVDGDGLDDLIIGAFGSDTNGDLSGRSYVVFGRSPFPSTLALSTLDGSNGFRIDGEASGDRSGFSVAAAGDVNRDGLDDLIIGASGSDPNGASSGRSYVVFGRSPFPPILQLLALDGSNGFKIDGEAAGDESGRAVAAAGDVNGDGLDDLIIGASVSGANGGGSGRSYVVYGRNSGFTSPLQLAALDGARGFKLDGEAAGDRSGTSVAVAGDVNGDEVDDFIIGAFQANPNGISRAGRSYVVFGRATAGTPVLDFGGQKLVDFGPVFVGVASPIRTVTLSNPGSGLLSIEAIDLPEPAFAITGGSCGPLPIRIRVDESCTLQLQFTPQSEGSALSPLTFTGTSVSSPDSIVLQGTGLPAPLMSLLPDPLDFGDVAQGASAVETLVVENTGAGTLEPGTVTISGPQAGEFSIELNDCLGAQLGAGEFCGIDIGFAPTQPGVRQATLTLQSNAPGSPNRVRLRGSSDVVFADGFESP